MNSSEQGMRIRFAFNRGDFQLDVDLDLPGNGITSLYGPSGSGKTSLLRAIAGLDRHASGLLKVGGVCWQDETQFMPPHQRPLGYVFQEASLFTHLNVEQNVRYGLKRIPQKERRIPFDRIVKLLDLEQLLSRNTDSLSGGERQRVAIARALAVSPRLLLLDEPLAAVDYSRRREILPYLESLHGEFDLPVLHVSHQPEEVARLADHLVLMNNGRVTAQGNALELFSRLDLPLAHQDDAASVIAARVAEHDHEHHLTRLEFGAQSLLVPWHDLEPGSQVRVQLAARDVSLTLSEQQGTSILNILPATIAEISRDADASVTVRLAVGDASLLSRITRKSLEDLSLHTGQAVFAQVKSVALLS